MSEPNPYEPPRELEPLTTGKVVKRGIGFAIILLLTPVAACATFFASCLVALSKTNPISIRATARNSAPTNMDFLGGHARSNNPDNGCDALLGEPLSKAPLTATDGRGFD